MGRRAALVLHTARMKIVYYAVWSDWFAEIIGAGLRHRYDWLLGKNSSDVHKVDYLGCEIGDFNVLWWKYRVCGMALQFAFSQARYISNKTDWILFSEKLYVRKKNPCIPHRDTNLEKNGWKIGKTLRFCWRQNEMGMSVSVSYFLESILWDECWPEFGLQICIENKFLSA